MGVSVRLILSPLISFSFYVSIAQAERDIKSLQDQIANLQKQLELASIKRKQTEEEHRRLADQTDDSPAGNDDQEDKEENKEEEEEKEEEKEEEQSAS